MLEAITVGGHSPGLDTAFSAGGAPTLRLMPRRIGLVLGLTLLLAACGSSASDGPGESTNSTTSSTSVTTTSAAPTTSAATSTTKGGATPTTTKATPTTKPAPGTPSTTAATATTKPGTLKVDECPAPETLEAEGYTCDSEGNLTPIG